ncbi:MAG TPA: PKD domain-containing protein [Candidatus Acidoferrales bacterium]|jgi:PKD repeat protein|nr:PKD domain-containing protein [Candidatus Acidoferrales bacterium]
MNKKLYAHARRSLAALTLAAVLLSSRDDYAGPYQLQLRGPTNSVCIIEASSDLQHWTAIATNQVSAAGRVNFNDPQTGKFPRRFYRTRQLVLGAPLGLLGESYNPAKILVKPKPGVSLAGLNLSLGVSVLNTFSKIGNLQIIKVPGNVTASALIATYQASGLVEYAEHDFTVQALNSPNDFYYVQGNLWNLNNTGQNGGTPGADIHAPAAWDTITSASNVIVAVVDTGVRYTHEDLAANMWVNPADGSHGTNTVAGSNDPNDDYGHGSHVSGTIGAVGNNGVGVVGVCWKVQIMACKFLDSSGNGTISDAILCLDYARAHGAKVVNASWGSPAFTSQALHDAVASLRDADIIFVAAAGNSALNNDTTGFYPADYRDLDNVVAVAATDRNDQLASFSDYGVTNVDLAAPGTPIYSCWNGSDSDYEYDDGTSMAAATVSGAMALLRAYYPNDAHRQIIERILNGVDQLPGLATNTISGGRLDLAKALNSTSPPPPTLTANFSANPTSGQAPLAVQFTDSSTGGPVSWNWNFGDGSTSTTQNPAHTFNSAGNFTVTLTVANGTGQTSSKNSVITATNATATPVTAGFSANPSSGQAPLAVQFTDQSTGPVTNWSWSFGDGSASSVQSPSHTYSSAGSFTATLTVTGSSGQTSSANHTITVTNVTVTPVNASFSANPSSGQAPLAVQFTDQSTGPVASWSWNFGDGVTSSVQNPSHTYNSAGSFTATLTVNGSAGQTSSASHTITVTNVSVSPVNASFSANPSSGQAPLAVQFTDQSTGPVTGWSWNFGDGATSSVQNPNHTYNSAGSFTAMLTVTGSSGQASSASHTITVTNATVTPVNASFSANPSSGQAPLTVQFTDQSTGPVTAWSWNFGDGATSSVQNPSHTYSNAGSFTATLTATGSNWQTSSASRTITVTNAATPPPTVTVVASQSLASILAPGAFTITRTGNTSSTLTVNYSLGGSAHNGVDYQTLSGTAVIPAGATTANVVVKPEGLLTVLQTVVLTLSPNPGYIVGSPNSATVTILVEAGGL